MSDPKPAKTDVVLVGAGIMSGTLGALLRLVEPDWSITLFERLDGAAAESSDPWNNAGTGHAALCELNYTPERPDGSIDISKAVQVNEQFQVTRQFWAYAVETGVLPDVRSFLNPDPARQLRARCGKRRLHAAPLRRAARQPAIRDDGVYRRQGRVRPAVAADGRERDFSDPVALSWPQDGTDVDFGALSRQLIGYTAQRGMTTLFGHEVRDLRKEKDGSWALTIVNRRTGEKRRLNAKFVFVGAGGGALPLLQKAGIPGVKGYGGFPIGGRFLRSRTRTWPPCTGPRLRPPAARRAPSRGLASGRAHHQRQIVAAVRTIRRLVAEVLEAGQDHRPAAVGQAEQRGVDRQGRAHACGSGALPDRPVAAVAGRPGAGAA